MAVSEDQTEVIVVDLFTPGLFIYAGSVVDVRFLEFTQSKSETCPCREPLLAELF